MVTSNKRKQFNTEQKITIQMKTRHLLFSFHVYLFRLCFMIFMRRNDLVTDGKVLRAAVNGVCIIVQCRTKESSN